MNVHVCGHTPEEPNLWQRIKCFLGFHEWGAGMLGSACKWCYTDCIEDPPWHFYVQWWYWDVTGMLLPIYLEPEDTSWVEKAAGQTSVPIDESRPQ